MWLDAASALRQGVAMWNASARLGSVRGVPIRLHWTLGLALVVVAAWVLRVQGVAAVLWASLAALLLFGSVLAHELGHVAMAQRYGLKTRTIMLYPVGGAAMMELKRVSPWVDLWVSVAGPVVSLGLGGLGLGLGWWSGSRGLWTFGQINAALGLFNLLPLYPMDGGRVLRAALIGPLGLERAHRLALTLGYVVVAAGVLGCVAYGLYDLAVVGAALWALQERERRRGGGL